MVNRVSIVWGCVVLLWCGSQPVAAHPDDLQYCSEIEVAMERLTCFDRALNEFANKGVTDTETGTDAIPAPVPVEESAHAGQNFHVVDRFYKVVIVTRFHADYPVVELRH